MNRSILALLVAFILSTVFTKLLIPILTKFRFGQNVRDDGPQTHLAKQGTPTMGGIAFIAAMVVTGIVFMHNNPQALAVIAVTTAFGLIGFIDDYIKKIMKHSQGFRAWQKLLAQIIVAVLFVWFWQTQDSYATIIQMPFFQYVVIDLGMFFPVFAVFIFLACSNGSNLTDGIDGLNTGVTVIILTFFFIVSLIVYAYITPAVGVAIGALLGFLIFNAHPAKVFMGDTGSLALGGLVAAVALMLHMPLLLVFVAIIYVIEALSVILQVGYFKLTKKRIFPMTPIHHSFEVKGWQETKVVALFYVITALGAFISFIAFRGIQ